MRHYAYFADGPLKARIFPIKGKLGDPIKAAVQINDLKKHPVNTGELRDDSVPCRTYFSSPNHYLTTGEETFWVYFVGASWPGHPEWDEVRDRAAAHGMLASAKTQGVL